MASCIVGFLVSAFVITEIKQSNFYIIMTALSIASSGIFLLLRSPKSLDVTHNPSVQGSCCQSLAYDLKKTLSLAVTKRMLKIVPLMGW